MKKTKWRRYRRDHAKRRADERYQVRLTNQDLKNIAGMIRNRKAETVRRISNSKRLHCVVYRETALLALYSCRHHEVITFLPPEDVDGSRAEN